jgi:hypothetical protein
MSKTGSTIQKQKTKYLETKFFVGSPVVSRLIDPRCAEFEAERSRCKI